MRFRDASLPSKPTPKVQQLLSSSILMFLCLSSDDKYSNSTGKDRIKTDWKPVLILSTSHRMFFLKELWWNCARLRRRVNHPLPWCALFYPEVWGEPLIHHFHSWVLRVWPEDTGVGGAQPPVGGPDWVKVGTAPLLTASPDICWVIWKRGEKKRLKCK